MMLAPFYPTCAASPAVRDLLGGTEPRIYPHGQAPEGVTYPYVVWQQIGGAPENVMAGRPDTDNYHLQVDVYGKTSEQVRTVASALRGAVELKAYITSFGSDKRDSVTGSYRYTFDLDWYVQR